MKKTSITSLILFSLVFALGCGAQLPTGDGDVVLSPDTNVVLPDTAVAPDTLRADEHPQDGEDGAVLVTDAVDVVDTTTDTATDTMPDNVVTDAVEIVIMPDVVVVDVVSEDSISFADTRTADASETSVVDTTEVAVIADTMPEAEASGPVDSGRSDACSPVDVTHVEPSCFFDYDNRWFHGCLETNCMCHSPTDTFCYGIIRNGCPSLAGPGGMPCDPRTERWIDYRCYPSAGACTTSYNNELRGFSSPVTCTRDSFVGCLDYGVDGCYFVTTRPAWENPNVSLPNCPRTTP